MDTKKLRQKILDLAIHGKLVPQNPNDEPASILLERIRAEKERLIKEGKIKQSKKSAKSSDTRHYENDVPFEVPESWVWQKLGDIGVWQSGATPSRLNKDYYGGDIPWLKTGDLNDGYIYEIPETITQKALKETSVKLNPAGSVLIAMYGATIGKIGILTYPATTNQACCACVDYQGIEQMYLFYFLLSHREEFIMLGGGGAQPNISKEKIADTFIPIPPLIEQQRLVKAIELWFALIDKLETAKVDLQTSIFLAKSKILDLAIHGKLVPQDPDDEPAIELLKRINPSFVPCDNGHDKNIPAKWCRCFVGDIANIIGGVSYKKDDVQSDGIRILRGGNIQNGKVLIEADDIFVSNAYYNSENEVKDGDIIVVSSTGSSTLIGKTGFADNMPRVTQIGAFLRILRFSHYLSRDFINLVFLSEEYKEYIRNIAKGSNINNIKNSYLSDYSIAIPPYNEQLRIVAKIEEIFAVLDEIQKSIED